MFLSAFNALVYIVRPDDRTFTNIGGLVGYHANLLIKRKSPIQRVDATITLLPRHSLLYLPFSKLIMRYDRLFVSIHLKPRLPGEAHLNEAGYAGFRGPKIQNADRLTRREVRWRSHDFLLYYEQAVMGDRLTKFIQAHPDPGIVRHIALVPDQRKCFAFMIPRKDRVGTDFAPVYQWIKKLAAE
ncbi:MAG: hypothetical protein P8X55_10080 [Desulfosarcinaceae bacterium]